MSRLNKNIAKFYNRFTPLWMNIWGEHMHQGYFGDEGKDKKNYRQAQVKLIDELIRRAGIKKPVRVLDAGCGVGGSARLLCKRFGSDIAAYTISRIQAQKARQLNEEERLENKIKIFETDILSIEKGDEKYDLIWALESIEHIAEKEKLFHLFYELSDTGGKLVIAGWCLNDGLFSDLENRLIRKIEKNYHWPPLQTIRAYKIMAQQSGFRNILIDDWSKSVIPFWDADIHSMLRWNNIPGFIKACFPVIGNAFSIRHIKKAYRNGNLRYCILIADK